MLSIEGAVIGSYRGDIYHGYIKDAQKSTSSIVKEDGELFAAYDYTDFGETEELTGSSFDNEICYTGAIYDKETGLYYMNARYYDPEDGRFISQDNYRGDMKDLGQWHLYAYCANNPINYTDPSGHAKVKWSKTIKEKSRKEIWYKKGWQNGKFKKLRIGWKAKYQLDYGNLKESQKDNCNHYIEYIGYCNDYVENMQDQILGLAVSLTLIAITLITGLASITAISIMDIVVGLGGDVLSVSSLKKNAKKWKKTYAKAQDEYKIIRNYGKKY